MPPGSVYTDVFTLPIGVKHPSDNRVHTYPSNFSPPSNSLTSVITVFFSKCTKCHSSGYMNSTAFGHKSFKFYLFNKERAKDVPVIGKKNDY